MKFIYFCLLVSFWCSPFCAASNSFKLRLTTDQPSTQIYRAIPVHIEIENISDAHYQDTDRRFRSTTRYGSAPNPKHAPDSYFAQFVITRPDGSTLYTTQTTTALANPVRVGYQPPRLAPGQTRSWDLLLGVAWDNLPEQPIIFSEPDTYTIKLVAYDARGKSESEPITVQVHEPQTPEAQRSVDLLQQLEPAQQKQLYVPYVSMGGTYNPHLQPEEQIIDPVAFSVLTELAEQDSETPYREYARLLLVDLNISKISYSFSVDRREGRGVALADHLEQVENYYARAERLRAQESAPELHDAAGRLAMLIHHIKESAAEDQ